MSDGNHKTIQRGNGVVIRNPLLWYMEDVAPPMLRSAAILTVVCDSRAVPATKLSRVGTAHAELPRWHG